MYEAVDRDRALRDILHTMEIGLQERQTTLKTALEAMKRSNNAAVDRDRCP